MRNGCISISRGFTSAVITAMWCLVIGGMCPLDGYQGYNVVQTADPALEASFLASTTNYFDAKFVVNPLFPGTYNITLLGLNTPYLPPVPPTTLEDALSLGATVYVYGFANGMTYQQNQEENLTAAWGSLCASATSFALIQTTTATFSAATCRDVADTILNQLFEQSLSTPTVIPPAP